MSSHKLLGAVCLLAAAVVPAAAWASIGEIFYTEGRVQVKRAAVQKDVGKGYSLESGDTVLTGAGSQVRMRFADDSYIALPDNSILKIDEYTAAKAGRKRTPSTAIFSLLRGGLRTVSGLIGSWSRDTYKVSTPVVTMGIRGTEYSVIYCNNDCPPQAPNGGYIEVLGGTAAGTNKDGTLTLDEGQWGEVHSPPKRVLQRPAAFVLHKSTVFDPTKPITVAPGDEKAADVDIRVEVRIEREEETSPSTPPAQPQP